MNIKYKQIIVIAIASIMIFSGFLILISQSSSPIEKNKKIIFNDISSSNVNFNFSFLNSNNYNKSGIIITNNSIWYYSTVNYSVCGENLLTGSHYNFKNNNPIYLNQIQLYVPLNYVYFVLANFSVYYINLNTFSLNFYTTLDYGIHTFLTNFGISSVFNDATGCSNSGIGVEIANFTSIKIFQISCSLYQQLLTGYSNFIFTTNDNNGLSFVLTMLAPVSYPNLNNSLQITKSYYVSFSNAQTTTFLNTTTDNTGTTTGFLYNNNNFYSPSNIIPSLLYYYFNPLNSTLILHDNVYIELTNLLQINSLDFSPQFYLNSNYQVVYTANFIININSFSGTGVSINNYYLYNGQITTNSYLNDSIPLNILPLNYSSFQWNKGHIIIYQNDYNSKNGVNYYYNISIYYSSIAPTFSNPYNLSSYIFPMSVLTFFILGGIIIYGKFKYGGKSQ